MFSLLGALVLFWISTRQFRYLARLAIWGAGAALLGWSAFGDRHPSDQFGLWQAIEDALNADQLTEAAIVQAFLRNRATVDPFIRQLLDFFVIAGAAMAALTAVAFTRGERLEQVLRPTILALLGFIVGSTATLALVAIGLGGQVKPQTYIGRVSQATSDDETSVHDGDTFMLGEVSLRLWGVDAPELYQECRHSSGAMEHCGEAARDQLRQLIAGQLVQCDRRQALNSRQTETFGRPLVQCRTLSDELSYDVGRELVRSGYAIQYQNNNAYGYEDAAREGAKKNVMAHCSLRPDIWRSRQGRSARLAFEGGATPPPEQAMGDCPQQP